MKKTINLLVLLGFVGVLTVFVSSCKKNNTTVPPGDNTALKALIVTCDSIDNAAVEGTSVGFYQAGSKAQFELVLNAAKVVTADPTATQTVINGALANLTAAETAFLNKKIQNVSTAGLVGQWLFNGNAKDFSGNGNNGTLEKGNAAFGGGMPTLTTDRFGNPNSAYHFDKGAYIKIPYTSALNPPQISISLWIKADSTNANNRFMGLDSWVGYKFQLNGTNVPFFTAGTATGALDRDDGQAIDTLKWVNLAVTYKSGEMTFYVNGVMIKQWTNTTGDLATAVSGQDLVIGCDASVYADVTTNFGVTDEIIPAAWGGYFRGDIDDVRLYNRVLTAGEVSSIYALEKP